MKIEFGIFLKVRREDDIDEKPDELSSPSSTVASETERSDPMKPDTYVRTGFQGARS